MTLNVDKAFNFCCFCKLPLAWHKNYFCFRYLKSNRVGVFGSNGFRLIHSSSLCIDYSGCLQLLLFPTVFYSIFVELVYLGLSEKNSFFLIFKPILKLLGKTVS